MSSNDVIKPKPGALAEQFSSLAPKRRPRTNTQTNTQAPTDARTAGSGEGTVATPAGSSSSTGEVTSRPAGTPEASPRRPDHASSQERGRPGAASGTASGQAKVRRTAFIPLDLADLAAVHCASTKRTRTQMVLHALAANLQTLPELLAQDAGAAAGGTEEDISDVFPDLEPTRRATPTRPLPLYFTGDQIERIDTWVTHYGARDRSHLITVALRAYLGRR